MTAIENQIVKLYEQEHWDLNLIAKECGFDLVEIKTCLMMYSKGYRSDIKANDPKTDYDDSDLEFATRKLVQIAQTTEDDDLAARICKYIRNDKKGRLDAMNQMGNLHISIFEFNQALKQGREAKVATQEGKKSLAPIVEVEAEVQAK